MARPTIPSYFNKYYLKGPLRNSEKLPDILKTYKIILQHVLYIVAIVSPVGAGLREAPEGYSRDVKFIK
jgi:hypothetical protein